MILHLIFYIFICAGDDTTHTQPLNDPPRDESITNDTDRFSPHITTNSLTGGPGSVTLQRSAGANLNTNLLLTGLFIGVHDRVEIGTSPAYYFTDQHRGNISIKYNFWRSREWNWATSLHYAHFRQDGDIVIDGVSNYYKFNIDVAALQFVVNYTPIGSKFSYGAAIASFYTEVDVTVGPNKDADFSNKHETGLDISYAANQHIDVSLGLGFMRETGITAYEHIFFGFGPSLRWKRDAKFLPSITGGVHYTPANDNVLYLLSGKIL